MFEEQLFNPQIHDHQSFNSGVAELDNYLHRLADQQNKKGLAMVRVLIDTKMPRTILGYYSLSAAKIDKMQIRQPAKQKLKSYPLACIRLGRLATDVAYRDLGLGSLLVGCAVERSLEVKKYMEVHALVVDAKKENHKSFYEHYGFTPCRDDPMTLYLPLGTSVVPFYMVAIAPKRNDPNLVKIPDPSELRWEFKIPLECSSTEYLQHF